MSNKKPDSYVENASLLTYGSNIGAPAIHVPNIESWKQPRVIHVNQQFQDKVEELKNEYQKLIDEYKWNDLVYKAKFSFEPVIGKIYHLYYGKVKGMWTHTNTRKDKSDMFPQQELIDMLLSL